MDLNSVVLFIYGLQAWFIFSFSFVVVTLWRTHALAELKAQLTGRPLIGIIDKMGRLAARVPHKVTEEAAFFKRGAFYYAHLLDRNAFIPYGYNILGLAFEEKALIFSPRCFEAAYQLRKRGFKNYTEIELCQVIREIEKDYGIKIDLKAKYDIHKGGNAEKTGASAIEFIKAELKDRKFNPWVLEAPIDGHIERSVKLSQGDKYEDNIPYFQNMQQFLKSDLTTQGIAEMLSDTRFVAKELATFGEPKERNWIAIGMFIVLIIVGIAIGFSIMSDVDLGKMFGSFGGSPAKEIIKTVTTTTLKGGPIVID